MQIWGCESTFVKTNYVCEIACFDHILDLESGNVHAFNDELTSEKRPKSCYQIESSPWERVGIALWLSR